MAQNAINRGDGERIAVLESSLDTHLRDCADSRREQAEAMRELRAELRQHGERTELATIRLHGRIDRILWAVLGAAGTVLLATYSPAIGRLFQGG